jgi:GAF domain-containing protein
MTVTSARLRATARRVNIAGYRVTDDHGDRLRVQARAVLPAEPNVMPDVALGLDRLCRAAVDELGFDQVSVTLMTTAGSSVLVASAGPPGPGIQELQFDHGEGPGHDAYAARRPVLIPDLRSCEGRWAGFAAAAIERGTEAVFAFPLQLGAVRFGVLTCVRARAGRLGNQELTACLIFGEVATELLLDSSPTGNHPDPQLHAAIHVHDTIYQAQGMVMVDLSVTLEAALARMRAVAFAESLSLQELATEIVTGGRSLRTVGDP